LWGGVAYSAGGVIDFVKWPTLVPGTIHAHELFHVAVLAGVALHFRFIWQFADGHVVARPGTALSSWPRGTEATRGLSSTIALPSPRRTV
jgi:hypothetical protein